MKFKIRKKAFLIICSIVAVLGIATYASTSQILKTNPPEIIELKGQKIIFGKWGDKPGEFGIDLSEIIPYTGPETRPAVDKEGNVFIYDRVTNRVSKFSNEGKLLLYFNLTAGQLKNLRMLGIVLDKKGDLYIGNLKFGKNGKFLENIPIGVSKKAIPIIYGFSENSDMIVSTDDFHCLIDSKGKIVRQGPKNQRFTPIGNKDYTISPGGGENDIRGDLILKSQDINKREEKKVPISLNSGFLSGVKLKTLSPIKLSQNGNLITVARKRSHPLNYMLLHINENSKRVTKAYVLPDEEVSTENPPVFGLDGNIYQSGFILVSCQG